MVSYGDFNPKELRNENLTICIQTSEQLLKSTPALGHLIIGSLLSVVYQANGNIKGRVLYMLDEVNFLGRLKALADARDGCRKYKITIHIFIIIKILKSFSFNKSTFKIINYICCYD
ncbi:type IV secretory system conjugative DNA transfer family protein [Commensalibacter melissae]|uniref:type IV secretory system conjugative DNA transfer family protein n=1 Tax=Commensalibacter melissae TaxID=2070537 RepID=UPI0038CFCEDA